MDRRTFVKSIGLAVAALATFRTAGAMANSDNDEGVDAYLYIDGVDDDRGNASARGWSGRFPQGRKGVFRQSSRRNYYLVRHT